MKLQNVRFRAQSFIFFLADLCQYKQFCYLEDILLEYFLEEVASLRYLYIDPNEKMSNKYKSFFF